jgi:HEAT repeat protein
VGPAAKAAAPALREALRDPQPLARVSAATALWRVAGDAEAALPVLREALHKGNPQYARQQALLTLGDMGPAAKAAAPAVRDAGTDPDPYLRRSAAAALRKIDPADATRDGPP